MKLIPSTHTYSEIRWTIPGWVGRIQERQIDTETGIELPTDVTKSGGEVDKTCDHTWVSADGRVSDFRSYLLYGLPNLTPYIFCPICGEKL